MRMVGARQAGGFTLVELAAALALLGLTASAVYLTATASQSVQALDGARETQQALRTALDRVAEELRWAEAVLPDPGCGGLCADRLTAQVPAGNPLRGGPYVVTFRRDAREREVERRVGRGVTNVAGGVDALAFAYFTASGAPAARAEEVRRVAILIEGSPGGAGTRRQRAAVEVFLRNVPAAGRPGASTPPPPPSPALRPTPDLRPRPPDPPPVGPARQRR